MQGKQTVSVSVISHGHGEMVVRLLDALVACPSVGQIILTLNIPETLSLERFGGGVTIRRNPAPRGFGANHNAAFASCDSPLFCPLNPDIEFAGDPFGALAKQLAREPSAALAAPLVLSRDGVVEDNFRHFPTIVGILRKALIGDRGVYPVCAGGQAFFPDWAAGMFMLFRSAAYRQLDGFDEGFHLYYEDVDICVRARGMGMKVLACPDVAVFHDARRASRRSIRFMRWHLASMLRYFVKHWRALPW